MNNMELKNLHDLMQSAFDRSMMTTRPKSYFPSAIGEFAKELATNPLFENVRQIIADAGKEALAQIIEAKMATLHELEKSIVLLDSYKQNIPALSTIIEECDKVKKSCPKNSNETIYDLVPIIKKACSFILWDRSQDHSKILEKFVKLDDKKNIIEYTFSLHLSKWQQEIEFFEREKKASVFNSFHYLTQLYLFYSLKGRPNKIQGFLLSNHHSAVSYLTFDAKNFDQALEEQKSDTAIDLGFDIEECKSHTHRVWEFIKTRLLSPKTEAVSQENS